MHQGGLIKHCCANIPLWEHGFLKFFLMCFHDENILFCTLSTLHTSFVNTSKHKALMSEDIVGGIGNLQILPTSGPLAPGHWCILPLLCPCLVLNSECPRWRCLWLCGCCFRKCPALPSDSLKNRRSLKNTVSWFAIIYFQGAVLTEFLQWRSPCTFASPVGEEQRPAQASLNPNTGLKTLDFTLPLTNLQFPEGASVTLNLGRNVILHYF